MKKFLKPLVVAFALLVSVGASAQLPLSFGINAGMNLSNVGGDIDDTDAKVGFQVGVTADLALPMNFFLQSGLSFTTKGYKGNGFVLKDGVASDADITSNAMYLQLPIRAGYKLVSLPGLNLNVNAGPYFAHGIGGKTKYESRIGDVKNDTFSKYELKRFDVGLGFGVGAEITKFTVNLGYEFGLINISKVDVYDIKNRNAFLTVGYKF
ncbi:hypothetical protein M2132_001144 [Dysgonomonas sp. PH5-45]|uniref:porin family protein n=1 Tax=unclassified Dysgonomonas TaxID=2630389 RepID=UPI0024747363|nr:MULTISPECIES: porin family protein [unclassified Dysgonomonas]MDH6354813.1 hypothetical protein [Dysgonomonas sp. PH5-45]MDH6387712.1 hypothetical protein [Dysgonomonas sp. PH5-37]